jgi:hypothetical protein
MNFQKIVLIIAIILLLVILIFIAMTLSKTKASLSWPPIVGECPDYWIDLSGNGEQCFNSNNLGICNLPTKDDKNTMNFNVNPFNSPETEKCSKYKWAKECKITWDGITTGIQNPCVESKNK